jgi:hypothetical protein
MFSNYAAHSLESIYFCLKNNFKIYIKMDIKTAPKYFGAVTPSSGSALCALSKATLVKIVN